MRTADGVVPCVVAALGCPERDGVEVVEAEVGGEDAYREHRSRTWTIYEDVFSNSKNEPQGLRASKKLLRSSHQTNLD